MEIICSVCTERLFGNDHITASTCQHVFHEKCFLEWIKKGKIFLSVNSCLIDKITAQNCPECRAPSSEASCRRLFFNSEPQPVQSHQEVIKLRDELASQKRMFEQNLHVEVEIRRDMNKELKQLREQIRQLTEGKGELETSK